MLKRVLKSVLTSVLTCALVLNTTASYVQAKNSDFDAESSGVDVVSEVETTDTADDSFDEEIEVNDDGSVADEDKLLGTMANTGTIYISGGTLNTDYEYDSEQNIITILTNKAMTLSDIKIYGDHSTSLVIDSPAGANLTLNSVQIEPSEVTEESIADGSAAKMERGRAGIEITANTGDVVITLKNKGDWTEYTNRVYGGKDRAAIEKNSDHTGTLTFQGDGRIVAVAGWSDPETKQGPAAIGSVVGKSTSNIIINSGRITCTTTSVVDTIANNYGAGLGSGSGGNATNIVINDAENVHLQSAFGTPLGAGYGASGKSDITINGSKVYTVTYFTPEQRTEIYAGTTDEPAASAAIGVNADDVKERGASCDITVTGGEITCLPFFGPAFSCGEGTFKVTGGSVYCDGGYDTDKDTVYGNGGYGVQAKKVYIDTPYDTEKILYFQSTHSYAIYADDVEIKNGIVGAFGSYFHTTTSTHYGVVVKNSFTMTGGFIQSNGGILAENGGKISVNAGRVLTKLQGDFSNNTDTVIGVDTKADPNTKADISFSGNSEIYSFGPIDAGKGTISVSNMAYARVITGKYVGQKMESSIRPAYSAEKISISGGKTSGYVNTNYPDDNFADIESIPSIKKESRDVEVYAISSTDEKIEYARRKSSDGGNFALKGNLGTMLNNIITDNSTTLAAKQNAFAIPPTISSDFLHQVRAAIGSTELSIVDELNADWDNYTYAVISPKVNINFTENNVSYVKFTSDEPKVQFNVTTDPENVSVRFESSDPETVSIDPDTGLATAHHAGTAVISASPTGYYVGDTAKMEFTVKKGDGIATISMDDWYYGSESSDPVITSSTHKISDATVSYEKLDGTPLDGRPSEIGEYRVIATFPENEDFQRITVSDTFSISMKKVIITPEDNYIRLVNGEGAATISIKVEGDGKLQLSNANIDVVSAEINPVDGNEMGTYTLTVSPKQIGKASLTLYAKTNDPANYRDADNVTIDIEIAETYKLVASPSCTNNFTYNREIHRALSIPKDTVDCVIVEGKTEARDAGNYKITVSLKSGYAWSNNPQGKDRSARNYSWTIAAMPITQKNGDNKVTISYGGESSYKYTGSIIEPPVTISHNGVELIEGSEYDITYSNNLNAHEYPAKATITITGKGNYTGQSTINFSISPYYLSDCTASGNNTLIYNGKVQMPVFALQDEYGHDLIYGKGYVNYTSSKGLNIGKYSAQFGGIGNYSGRIVVPFEIVPANLADLTVSGLTAKEYNGGEAITQNITLIDHSGNTIPETDYTISYENNTEPGMARLRVTPTDTGNLIGKRTWEFPIVKNMNDLNVIQKPTGKTLVYNGTVQTGVNDSDDYTVVENQGEIPGVYYAYVTPNKGNAWDTSGDVSPIYVRWEIEKVPLSAAQISGVTDQVYNGSAFTPAPVVKLGDFVVPSDCYNVTYTDNTEVGMAAVTIEARSTYVNDYLSGSAETTFNITPAEGTIDAPAAVTMSYASGKRTQNRVTIDIYYTGDGTLYANMSDTSVSTVSELTEVEEGHYTATLTPRGRGAVLLRLETKGSKNYRDVQKFLYVNVNEFSENCIVVDVPKGENHVYNGASQLGVAVSPAFITLKGDTMATDVGTYEVTATPKAGYAWDTDGDTEPRTIKWEITKSSAYINAYTEDVLLDIGGNKAASFSVSYNGADKLRMTSTDKSVAEVKLNKAEIGQNSYTLDIAAKSVGTTLITLYDEDNDNTFAAEEVTFYVSVIDSSSDVDVVPNLPSPKTELTYNGKAQIGIYGGEGYTLTGPSVDENGDSVGVNAGDYWVTANVKPGYAWSDSGDNSPKNIHWTIAPASLNDAVIEGVVDKKATGKKIYQDDMVVKIGGVVIPESEYDVSYDNQLKVGKSTITINGREGRNVIGSADVSFNILEVGSVESLTVAKSRLMGNNDIFAYMASAFSIPLGINTYNDMQSEETADSDNPSDLPETAELETAPGEIIVTYDGDKEPVKLIANISENKLSGIPITSTEVVAEDIGEDEVDIVIVEVKDKSQTQNLIDYLNKQKGVHAQPNYIYQTFDTVETNQSENKTLAEVNDPYSEDQYYLNAYSEKGFSGASVYGAWDTIKTERSVTVAVMDTGCDVDHPDLKANIDREHMWDAYNQSSYMFDGDGHGTHVCGIIGAVADNEIGIAGASYNANILPIKVFDDKGEVAYTSDIVRAYAYLGELIESGELDDLHVINMSLGGYGSKSEGDRALEQIISIFREEYQVLSVAAGGNGSGGYPLTAYCIPSDFDNVLSVTSLDRNGGNSFWSDYNEYKDISAPGEEIISTFTNNRYATLSGTSMASPLVSGIAAMMFAAVPGAYPDDVVDSIKSTAHSMDGKGNDRGSATGSAGAIDAAKAVSDLVAKHSGIQYFMHECTIDIKGIDKLGTQLYTGSAIIPEFTVIGKDGKIFTQAPNQSSTEGDYVVSIKNNVKVGTATITITGINSCYGTATQTFRICYNLESNGYLGKIAVQSYYSNFITPMPQVSYGSDLLVSGIDYLIRYENNNEVGEAKIFIDGINDYRGTLSETFYIVDGFGQVQIPKAVASLYYNGKVQTGVPDSPRGCYSIIGNTARNVGEYTATATLSDGFTWEDGSTEDKKISYSIERADAILSAEKTAILLKNDKASASVRIIYGGDAEEDFAVTSDDENIATAQIDGNVLEVNAVNSGVTRLTVSAKQGKNYNAAATTIVVDVVGEMEYAQAVMPSGVSLEYNGQKQSGILAKDGYELTPINDGCTLDEIGNAVAMNAGKYKVNVKRIKDYSWQDVDFPAESTVTFTVAAIDGERVNIDDIAPVEYTGSDAEPKVTATFKGMELVLGVDYDLSYYDNTGVGTASVQLKFKGNYTGSVIKNFEIINVPTEPTTPSTAPTTETTEPTEPTTASTASTTETTEPTEPTTASTAPTTATTKPTRTTTVKPASSLGKGADGAAVEQAILGFKNDKDPNGSTFNLLQVKSTKTTKKSIKISYKKPSGTKTFVIYGNRCGKSYKKLAETTKKSFNYKNLKKGKYYKFLVVALDKNGKVVATSKTIHVATKDDNVGNPKKVTITNAKKAKSINKGKSVTLKTKVTAESKKLKVSNHRKVKFESSNTKVAKVSASGKITATKEGTCYIYAYTQNGVMAKVKVTVKK